MTRPEVICSHLKSLKEVYMNSQEGTVLRTEGLMPEQLDKPRICTHPGSGVSDDGFCDVLRGSNCPYEEYRQEKPGR